MNKKSIITLVLLAFFAGAAVGYFFGYDHGWERATSYVQAFTK